MKFMLDTNTWILLLGGHPNVVARVSECFEGELVLSAIVFAELAIGSWHDKPPSILVTDRLAQRFPPLPFDVLAAKLYAQLPFRRGSFDRLIAAHALALNLTLVTNNERDFADIPGLKIENWTL
jgi:tRNA(fMet)-specific endonuclease VapC